MKTRFEPVDAKFFDDPLQWLVKVGNDNQLNYMLLHDADGVAWGQLESNTFKLSYEVFPSDLDRFPIRPETLQQVRLFDTGGELFVWRTGDGFNYRLIIDGQEDRQSCPDEFYWLWGTGLISNGGFTLMNEGQQGLRHAPPVGNVEKDQRIRLRVRHYLEEADNGWQRIQMSRLVGFDTIEGGQA